eukprot:6283601-Pyramimonas_sp.AAC.1
MVVWLWAPHAFQGLRALVRRCGQLGLAHASETTCAHIWCVWVIARAPPSMEPMTDAADVLRKKRAIMDGLQALRGRGRLPHHGVVLQYPDTVDELQAQFPAVWESAYGGHTVAAPPPIDAMRVDILRRMM